MGTLPPRAVVVTRATELDALLADHGTFRGAEFFLRSRGQDVEEVQSRHQEQNEAAEATLSQIPLAWRRARVDRASLDRFLFEPEDIVLTVGPDGLVANVAKYLSEQPVIGVFAGEREGILATHHRNGVADALMRAETHGLSPQARTLVHASTADGQSLFALNEIFIGHRTHQSARYMLTVDARSERHSSSGLIITTGTGATGWATSVTRQRANPPRLPSPLEPALLYLVREAWPSPATGCELTQGVVGEGDTLEVRSEMNEGGVLFGDGLEQDFLALPYGEVAKIRVGNRKLRLVSTRPAPKAEERPFTGESATPF